MTKEERNKLLIGLGIGAAAGIGTGIFIGRQSTKKKHEKELKKARRSAYIEGRREGFEKGTSTEIVDQAYEEGCKDGFEEHREMMKIFAATKINGRETPEELIQKIEQYNERTERKEKNAPKDIVLNLEGMDAPGWYKVSDDAIGIIVKTGENTGTLLKDADGKYVLYPIETVLGEDGNIFDNETLVKNFTAAEKDPDILKEVLRLSELDHIQDEGNAENVSAEPPKAVKQAIDRVFQPAPVKIGMADYDTENHQVVFSGSGGTRIAYPANLFIGADGGVLDSLDIRANIKKHEHNRARLNLIWNQMGWGAYIPDLDGEIANPTEEDINDWDLSLDEEPAEEQIETKERYMDEIERYKANPEEAPRIISRQEFSEEAYLDKTFVDFYDKDGVFVESTDGDRELDAYTYFGVTDGNDLFRMKDTDGDDDDPDIVHVKNFKMNCVMEVTRWHKSYASMKDGGAYIPDGSTD